MAAAFKSATVNASDVPGTLTDYTAYVDLARLGITTLAEAQSIRVYADSGKTTEWARDITSVEQMHVKIPSLTSTTTIYIDWDGSRADYSAGDTYGQYAVWTNNRAVYHLESLTSDYAGNAYSLTNTGTVTNATGQIQDCADTGSANTTKVLSRTTTDLITMTSANSVTFLCNFTTLPSGTDHVSTIHLFQIVGSDFRRYGMRYQGTNGFGMELVTTGFVWSGDTVSAGTWNHVAYTYDATTIRVYLNGTEIQTQAHTFGLQFGGPTIRTTLFGADGGAQMSGKLDEVRFRNSQLSANWITSESNNLMDEAGFWGTWTTLSGGSTSSPLSNLGLMGVG